MTTKLTVTIDEHLLRLARIRAVERGTSVNAIVRAYLEMYAGAADEAPAAAKRFVALSKKTASGSGDATWTRDELHVRSV